MSSLLSENEEVCTEADTSVMGMDSACKLKKVSTLGTGSQVHRAEGSLLTPMGRCTVRVSLHGFMYRRGLIILLSCSRYLVLGMDSLQANGAVMNFLRVAGNVFHDARLASSTDESYVNALRIVSDNVTLPHKSSVLTLVTCDAFDKLDNYECIAIANILLLLRGNICIARGLVLLQNKCSQVLLSNFSDEFQHVSQGNTVAFFSKSSDIGTWK